MRRESGVALLVSLILLTVLSLLGLSGVRLSAMELRLSLGDELGASEFEQAQSRMEANLRDLPEVAEGSVQVFGDSGMQVRGLAATTPPVGTGYSADRFRAAQLRAETSDDVAGSAPVGIDEGIAVIHGAANPPLAAPALAGPDFAEMGLALATPRTATVVVGANADGSPRRLQALFLGGGYDPGKDAEGAADDSQGNALFVARADTGELIWKAVGPRADGGYTSAASAAVFHHDALRDSIASGLALLDSDGDGAVDRILAGDTGGNLWRADLGGSVEQWKLTRLACLGRHGGDNCAPLPWRRDDRRFFHAPDIAQMRDARGRYDAVIIASGDRQHPLATATEDFVYLVKDRATGIGAGTDGTAAVEGWRVALRQPGEKGLSAPITMARAIYFTSYVPPATAAPESSQGRSWLHTLDLATGAATTTPLELQQAGLPPQPVYVGSRDAGGATLAAPCTATLHVGEQAFDAPACARFRTFWQRRGT